MADDNICFQLEIQFGHKSKISRCRACGGVNQYIQIFTSLHSRRGDKASFTFNEI